jgi:4-amino-4-deoxy-L-arabinose transferase-like glycosyltransferase
LRAICAATADLRVDEVYYWTWSRETVASYLDHSPAVAWLVRASTFVLGDTNFGVRFPGFVAMLAMELLIADIVWRATRDIRCACIAVLLTDLTIDYGLLMIRIGPDIPLIPATLALVWSLIRLTHSGDLRWWLAAGAFGGLALLSKYTAILLLPAVAAFVLFPPWRMTHLRSPWLWLGTLLALLLFAPVIIWNAQHDWVSFRFQLDRAPQVEGLSAKFLGEFLGQQLLLVGPLLFPLLLLAALMLAQRGYTAREPIAILFSTAVLFPLAFFLWHSLSLRVGDGWPLFVWPLGLAGVAINLHWLRRERPRSVFRLMSPSLILGGVLIFATVGYYGFGSANYLGINDPIGREAGFAALVQRAEQARVDAGASWFATTDYRITALLCWHLRDRVPVVQLTERNRFIGFRSFVDADITGPALYVAPAASTAGELLRSNGAQFQRGRHGQPDMAWRGLRHLSDAAHDRLHAEPVTDAGRSVLRRAAALTIRSPDSRRSEPNGTSYRLSPHGRWMEK